MKKQKQIAREIFWVIYELGLTLDDITSIKKKIDKFPFKIQEGNFWTNLEKHFNDENLSNFFKFVIDIKPIGLNKSPNVSCGKVELAFLLLLKDSKQPKVGDIQLEKTYELKGEDTRISSNWLTGQEYKILTEDIFKDLINPNLTRNGAGIESFAFEIEKSRHNRFYVTEFEKVKMEILIERFTKLFTLLKIEGNLNLLAKNIYINSVHNNINILPIILSNKNSMGLFQNSSIVQGSALSGLIQNNNNIINPTISECEYKLPVFKLDLVSSIFNLNKPKYLKIDVDGLEYEILRGSNDILKNLHSILIEVDERNPKQAKSISQLIETKGFYLKKEGGRSKSSVSTVNQIWEKNRV